MQYLLIAIVLMVLCVFGFSCRKSASNDTGRNRSGPITVSSSHYLSREDIQKQFTLLAKSLPPTGLDEGTSFGPVDIPKSIDYVCPVCGHKTEYAFDSGLLISLTRNDDVSPEEKENLIAQYGRMQKTRNTVYNLDACHQIVETIDKLNVTLDESQFCSACSASTEAPKLVLTIHYPEPHRVVDIDLTDLTMLKAFTESEFKYKNSKKGESALKDQVTRLQELLGVGLNRKDSPYLSKRDLRRQLAYIAKSPPPKELAFGAMCYMTTSILDRVEYICPACGEKTLYASQGSDNRISTSLRTKAFGIAANLETCRRLVQNIYQIDIALDEIQFCNHCSPDIGVPELGIIIRYPDNENLHRVWGITEYDLIMIQAATNSKLKYTDWHDNEIALKDQLSRLEELLGVSLDDTEHP